jgi:20S proteasome alpha/beta subunit
MHVVALPPLSCWQIFPHGSTDALPYATMGSGSLNAMAVFEAGYKDDMSREEAMALAARAIRRCGSPGSSRWLA